MGLTDMTLTRLIGDIHGHWHEYHQLTKDIEYPSIQLGDFGIGFNGNQWEERVVEYHTSGQHRFIRGNHDHPTTCKVAMPGYIQDGTIENGVMFIGGARSFDWQCRTEGVDWWRDEELTYRELDTLISKYEEVKPRVMITHDCPTLAAYYMFIKEGNAVAGSNLQLTRTAEALQAMFELHQPENWYFGHWHETKTMKINGTTFQCLGIDYHKDVEL